MFKLTLPTDVDGEREQFFSDPCRARERLHDIDPDRDWDDAKIEQVPGQVVTLLVDMAFQPTDDEMEWAKLDYLPTPEVPYPDEEWIWERCAIRRLDQIDGVRYMTVIDEAPR